MKMTQCVCAIVGLYVLPGMAGPAGRAGDRAAQYDWPIFRGDQALSGAAAGSVSTNLVLKWFFRTGGAVRSSAVVGGGRVFVGSDDGNLYALVLKDGRKAWSFETGGPVEASPLLADGYVIVGSESGALYALDICSGKQKWSYKTGARIAGSANWYRTDEGEPRVVVGSYDNRIHCVRLQTGLPVWQFESESFINGAPAVSGDLVVFGGCDAKLHLVSAPDGREIAAVDTGSYIAGSAAVAGGRAFVGNYAGSLLCVDMEKRETAWRYGGDDGGSPFLSSPAVSREHIVAGSRDRAVHCLASGNGKAVWTFRTGGDVDASPVICGERVVAGSGDGRLYLLSLADGSVLWSYDIGEVISGSPAVAAGCVIVGAEDGVVYAFSGLP